MKKKLPTQLTLLSYTNLFNETPSEDRLKLISQIPKAFLITEIAGLNARLKSFRSFSFKYDLESQLKELKKLCGENGHLYQQYYYLIINAIKQNQSTITNNSFFIFSRPSCLIALQEIILKKENLPCTDFKMSYEDWDNLLKYLFCVNEVAASFEKSDSKDYSDFEILAANQVFLNELSVILNPVLSIERFIKWINYLKKQYEISKYFENFKNPFGFPFEYFLKQIVGIFVREEDDLGLECYFKLENDDPHFERFFDEFSQKGEKKLSHKWDLSEIRYSPFFKEKTGHFILLDKIFIIEKIYEQFINNFFNKYLKETEISFDKYRGYFGLFFENYVADIFEKIFGTRKHAVLKSLDELKLKIKKQEHEIADIYLRENKKIFLAQVKSNGLRTDQFSGQPERFFTDANGNDPEFLYKNFGIFQLIESIKFLGTKIHEIDQKFPLNKKIEIFPSLIVNEKMFHTILLPKIFNEKFFEYLPENLPKKFIIRPLTIIHIEDLERMEDSLIKKKIDLWKILRINFKGAALNRPFNITLNKQKLEKEFDIEKFTFQRYIDFDE